MLCNARTGLTKAVVTGPGRAILFYGRHSLGEGLTLDKARDAAFLLTGVGTWVWKPAYLATDTMTVQKGWRVIAQAITDCWVKARGLGCLCVNLPTQQPFRFDCPIDYPRKDNPGILVPIITQCHTSPREAGTATDIRGTIGNHCVSYHHPPQTMGQKQQELIIDGFFDVIHVR